MIINLVLSVVAALMVMVMLAAPAAGDWVAACNGPDPALRISGCSKLIASGKFDLFTLSQIYQNRGIAYFWIGNFAQALADFTTAIRLSPESDNAYENRGNAYLRLRRLSEARDDFNAALAINPESVRVLANRGLVSLMEGQFGDALNDLNRSIALKPDYALALNSRGVVFEKMGMFGRAIDDYEKALQIDPDLSLARKNLNRLRPDAYRRNVGPQISAWRGPGTSRSHKVSSCIPQFATAVNWQRSQSE